MSETAEQAMTRLAQEGRYDVRVHVVNAAHPISLFFMAEILETGLEAFARRSPHLHRKCYGVGTGDTLLEALLKCEQVAARSTPYKDYVVPSDAPQ